MNFSIYMKLFIAYYFKKVKITNEYPHLQFVMDNNYFERIPDGGSYEVSGFPMLSYSDYYSLTTEGKTAFFDRQSLLHTRIIAWVALIISMLTYLFK